MQPLRSLKPPPTGADPRETFEWIRRCEIFGGIALVLVGFALVSVPAFAAAGAIVGFVADGWGAAIFISVLMGVSGGAGAWWSVRRERST